MNKAKRNLPPLEIRRLAEIFKTISHPARLKVLELLESNKKLSVAEMLKEIDVEQSLLSHHLTRLRKKRLIACKREGRNIYYFLVFSEITKIFDCMEKCKLICWQKHIE